MENSQDFNVTQQMMDNPFQYIDRVLTYMAMDKDATLKLSTKRIWQNLKAQNEGFDLTEGTLRLIMNKLVKDAYVFFEQHDSTKVYKITIEGLIFQKLGGYEQKLNNDTLHERQEESNQNTQRILFWFTFIVAVGTLIAAVYYILEIWRFFHPLISTNNGKFN